MSNYEKPRLIEQCNAFELGRQEGKDKGARNPYDKTSELHGFYLAGQTASRKRPAGAKGKYTLKYRE